LLVAASVVFTLGMACAAPLAAFGAAAALTLPRRDALLVALGIWFANQAVGFAVLGYPLTADCLAWGAILGVVAVLSTVTPQAVSQRLHGHGGLLRAITAFAASFAVYEGGLYLVTLTVMGGGLDAYAPAMVLRVFEINALAFAGLVAVSQAGRLLTPAVTPVLARP